MIRIILLSIFVAGCGFTPEGDFIRGTAKQYGAQAYDEGLENAEYFTCEVASMGSVRRKYGKTKETAEHYRNFCGDSGPTILFESSSKNGSL